MEAYEFGKENERKIVLIPEVREMCEKAGFSDVCIEKNDKGWICVNAEKRGLL